MGEARGLQTIVSWRPLEVQQPSPSDVDPTRVMVRLKHVPDELSLQEFQDIFNEEASVGRSKPRVPVVLRPRLPRPP